MFLEYSFIYFLTAVTSVVIVFIGVKKLGLRMPVLGDAFRDVVECVGAGLVFFGINVALGIVVVFLIRGLWRFFPLYAVADAALVVLSAFQGFIFHLWWRRSRG